MYTKSKNIKIQNQKIQKKIQNQKKKYKIQKNIKKKSNFLKLIFFSHKYMVL